MFRRGTRLFRRVIWPWGVLLGMGAFLMVAVFLSANGVDTTVTDQDREIIAKLGVDDSCGQIDDHGDEMECISQVQAAIYERYPSTRDAFVKGVTDHRVADYDARGYGSCYDRATFIEQALRHYGFDVRRVAIFKSQSSPLNYLKPGIRSHALSEVKTSKGWMVVESIDPLLGVDRRGRIYTMGDIRQGLREGSIDDDTFGLAIPEDFFDGEFVYVYGLHSRHGYFFEPHLPVPEIDWAHFGFGR